MLALRRIGEYLVADVAIGHDIVAQAQMVGDDRGHRLDALGIDLAQLLDPAENVAEFRCELFGFGIGDRDTGKAG